MIRVSRVSRLRTGATVRIRVSFRIKLTVLPHPGSATPHTIRSNGLVGLRIVSGLGLALLLVV